MSFDSGSQKITDLPLWKLLSLTLDEFSVKEVLCHGYYRKTLRLFQSVAIGFQQWEAIIWFALEVGCLLRVWPAVPSCHCHSPTVHLCRHSWGGQRSTSGVVPQDDCPLCFETGSPTGICCLPDSAMLANLGAQDASCLHFPSFEITSTYHCLTSYVSIKD